MGAAFGLAITLLYRYDSVLANLRLLRPIKYCGVICYSLYLVHWPVAKFLGHVLWDAGAQSDRATVLATIPICVAVSVALATAFHFAVERRFLNLPAPASAVERSS